MIAPIPGHCILVTFGSNLLVPVPGPEVIKHSMLNTAEHEMSTAHKF